MKESTLGKSRRNVNDVASVLVVWETKEGMKLQRVHTGEKPYEYKWCEKCFMEVGYLES